MSIPTQPIDLNPETERAGGFGFFDISTPLELSRLGNVQWSKILDLEIWDPGHFAEVTEAFGVIDDSLAAEVLPNELPRTDGGDSDSLPDCLAEARLFRYELRQTSTAIELEQEALRLRLTSRVQRVHEIAFSHALAQRLEDSPTDVNPGRRASGGDAVAILDDALVGRGIYNGVIHVPAFLSAQVHEAYGDATTTPNGARIHYVPSVVMGVPGACYATGAVRHEMEGRAVSVVPGTGDAVGQGATASGDPHVSENVWFARGVFHGLVAFDGTPLVIQSNDLTTLTTAV